MSTNPKIFRSYLYCSGIRLDLFHKACASEADAVTIDLEDSVPTSMKHSARQAVVDLLRQSVISKPIFVKTNPLSTCGADDVKAISPLPVVGLRIPKVKDEAEVMKIHDICERNAFKGNLQLMLETASGIQNVDGIAKASSYANALIVGEEDLRNDLGCERSELDYALSRVVIASRAAKLIPPILSVWPFIQDTHGLEASAIKGKRMGLWGRLCVHPSQVVTVNQVFTPSDAELQHAKYVLDVFRDAESAGRTAIKDKDGNYLSVWTRDNAERICGIASALG